MASKSFPTPKILQCCSERRPCRSSPLRHSHITECIMNKRTPIKRRRKKLRLNNFDYSDPNYVFFLTICARHLSSPFSNTNLADQIVSSIHFVRRDKGVSIFCYCLMPDHLHIVTSPSAGSGNISEIMRAFKSFTTNIGWKNGIEGKLWQKSFYDHIIRKDEDLNAICQYILANPVRKRLVTNPEDWKYSGLLDRLPV